MTKPNDSEVPRTQSMTEKLRDELAEKYGNASPALVGFDQAALHYESRIKELEAALETIAGDYWIEAQCTHRDFAGLEVQEIAKQVLRKSK